MSRGKPQTPQMIGGPSGVGNLCAVGRGSEVDTKVVRPSLRPPPSPPRGSPQLPSREGEHWDLKADQMASALASEVLGRAYSPLKVGQGSCGRTLFHSGGWLA